MKQTLSALVVVALVTADELGLSVSYQGKRLGVLWAAASGTTGTITLTERDR